MSNTTFTYKSTTITSDWANQINQQVFAVANAAAIRTSLTALSPVDSSRVYTRCRTLGYYSPGDGGNGEYYYDPSDTTSADNGGTVFVASDGARWKLVNQTAMTFAQFGAKGDGTDDWQFLSKAAAALQAGATLAAVAGKTYLIASGEVVMPASTTMLLIGATLTFTSTDTTKRCLALSSGCRLLGYGGKIQNTSGVNAVDGTYQTPVVVGVDGVLTAYSNIEIAGVSLYSNVVGGNCITILGAYNFSIHDIVLLDSAYTATPIVVHWNFDANLLPPGPGTYTGTTLHPHSFKIWNVSAGTMSYGTSGAGSGSSYAVVFIAGSYNFEVSDIEVFDMQHGAGVFVWPGDWGYQFGTNVEQALGMGSVRINNVHGQIFNAVDVTSRNSGSQALNQDWPANVSISGVSAYGKPSDQYSQGIRLGNFNASVGPGRVVVRDCHLDSFYTGLFLGGSICNLTVEDNSFQHCTADGVSGLSSGGGGRWTIQRNQFWSNNTSLASSGVADINLTHAAGVNIFANYFNSPNCPNNFAMTNTVSRVRIRDNHTDGVSAAGPLYSLAGTDDFGLVIDFTGNTTSTGATNGMRGGQVFIPSIIGSKAGTSVATPSLYFAETFPSSQGAYNTGDVVLKWDAAASGPPGYVCTSGGSSGTWKAMANLAA